MSFIKPSNTISHRDRLASLEEYADMAKASKGDEAIRASILAKVEAYRAREKSYYCETVQADGSTRVRHPAIAVVRVEHNILDVPEQMFGSYIKSLTAYTVTVQRAEVIVQKDGLLSYEPYEEVARFKLSDPAFNQMISSSGRGSFPVTMEKVLDYQIEPPIQSAFAAKPMRLAKGIEEVVIEMSSRLQGLTADLESLQAKGGKLSKKAIDELMRSGIPGVAGFTNGVSYQVSQIAEFSQEVAATQRIEIEALISLKQGEQ
ncbi:hypothetical protein [Pseudomonas putida]|uniref:Uncharacterized protein n=1 Tax=Pseudomonas putida TaxID=303 RepID=A0A8I1JL92_PSEPU|nr:hypothetical protein [Pseudomonas putida]MBI6885848.1 hypothetical protein [Pseudomonas putida]